MPTDCLRIATRESPLALWQAEHVRRALSQQHPSLAVELLPMTTEGDKLLGSSLAKVGGKGLFVKELERALLQGRADIAVHSMKDVPVEFPPGLGLAVICKRGDPQDAFVSPDYARLDELPPGARLGTSSLRRRCQLAARRPDLEIIDIRGNVGTRLAKLSSGDFDALILAAAGLQRLGLSQRIRHGLATEDCLPAAGQGAMGIECRSDDEATRRLLDCLHHRPSAQRVQAERAVTRGLQGGCLLPVAAYAEFREHRLHLRSLVGEPDGSLLLRAEGEASPAEAESLGQALAEDLLAQGAGAILARVNAS